MCILNFLKEINDHYANLLILGVAAFALAYAIKEYKGKDLPVFETKLDLFTREDGAFVNIEFQNQSNHPIKIEVLKSSVRSHLGTFLPTVERFRILQEKQKDVSFFHHFDNSQIERLKAVPDGEL